METPRRLKSPSGISLSRVSDRATFLYLDKCRIEQDDNGTHARVELEGGTATTYLPTANLACLLIGPGTSITSPAMAALARNGCSIVSVGAGGVRGYSTWSPISGSTRLLTEQAKASSDPVRRLLVSRNMLARRFPDDVLPTEGLTLERLRGIEGARVKAFYQHEARRRRLSGWRRKFTTNDGETLDAVNEALNYANTALYGVVLSVVCALGMSPGLGFIHEGNRRAFVLDIADLYKTEVTIPLAFRLHESATPGQDATQALRDNFRLLRILPRIVDDIHELLEVGEPDDWDVNELSLWGTTGLAKAGHNRDGRDQ